MFLLKRAKREKIILATVVATLLMIIVALNEIGVIVLTSTLSSLLVWFVFVTIGGVVWWTLDGGTNYRYLVPTMIPVYALLLTFYKVFEITQSNILRGLTILVFVGVFNFLLRSLNVLFVSTFKKIPLRQAGLTVLYFINMFLFFVFSYIQYSRQGWGINLQLLTVWIMLVAMAFSYLYYLFGRNILAEIVVFAAMSLEILAIVNFWPANNIVNIVSSGGLVFILLGVMEHYLKRDMTPRLRREYFVLSLILISAYLFF